MREQRHERIPHEATRARRGRGQHGHRHGDVGRPVGTAHVSVSPLVAALAQAVVDAVAATGEGAGVHDTEPAKGSVAPDRRHGLILVHGGRNTEADQ